MKPAIMPFNALENSITENKNSCTIVIPSYLGIKMSRIEKTVFISYRRTNFYTALAVYQDLTQHGYDVFFDYQSIDSGNFEKVILENIRAMAHFLVILSSSALERCNEPGDWLRREIETAIDERRNIIPLMMEGFDFGSVTIIQGLTGKLALLKTYNGLPLVPFYFPAAMEVLRTRYLNVPLEDIPLQSLSAKVKEISEAKRAIVEEAEPVKAEQLTSEEWFERGYKLFENRNFNEAIQYYTRALELKPNFFEAYENCGESYDALGNFKEAIENYTKAIELKPEDGKTYYNRGVLRNKSGDFKNAVQDFDEAIRLNFNNVNVYASRGNVHRLLGQLDKALEDYGEVIRLNPTDPDAYNSRGVIKRTIGDLNGAIEDYNRAIDLNPEYERAYSNRAIAYRNKGDFNRALSDFTKAIKLEPNNIVGHYYNRGVTFALMGDNQNALIDLTLASDKNPKDVSIRVSLLRVLKSMGKQGKVDNELRSIESSIETENEYNRACFESILGNKEKAIEFLRLALDKNQVTKEWARQDPDFENIRDDPKFKELVGIVS